MLKNHWNAQHSRPFFQGKALSHSKIRFRPWLFLRVLSCGLLLLYLPQRTSIQVKTWSPQQMVQNRQDSCSHKLTTGWVIPNTFQFTQGRFQRWAYRWPRRFLRKHGYCIQFSQTSNHQGHFKERKTMAGDRLHIFCRFWKGKQFCWHNLRKPR